MVAIEIVFRMSLIELLGSGMYDICAYYLLLKLLGIGNCTTW